jgi:hypothetical protein
MAPHRAWGDHPASVHPVETRTRPSPAASAICDMVIDSNPPAAGTGLDQLLSRAVASAGAMNALSEVWK